MPKAKRFKADMLEMYPEDQVRGSGLFQPAPVDDSLTSLNWLQSVSILSADPEQRCRPGCPSTRHQLLHKSLGTDSPSSPTAGDTAATGMPQYLGSDSTVGPLFSRYPRIQMQPIPPVEVDYKTDPKAKPPHSHASLICMALQASEQQKVTLSTIYKWMKENFCYYRHAEPSWQNSIRHTLSFHKCFKKVPRQKDEPGKGGFWQIDPEHSDMFVNGIFRRRKLFQGCQGTASASSVNEGVSPEQKPLSSTDNGGTSRSTETLLDFDILAAACNDILGWNCSTLEDLDHTAAVKVLESQLEGMQQPTGEQARWRGGGGGDVMNHQLSYGDMDLCATTMDDTGNRAELQMPLHYLHQHQDQQHLVHLDESFGLFSGLSGVGEVQPWVEVTAVATETVPSTLDQGFGLSEGFLTATYDHPPPPPTLTVL